MKPGCVGVVEKFDLDNEHTLSPRLLSEVSGPGSIFFSLFFHISQIHPLTVMTNIHSNIRLKVVQWKIIFLFSPPERTNEWRQHTQRRHYFCYESPFSSTFLSRGAFVVAPLRVDIFHPRRCHPMSFNQYVDYFLPFLWCCIVCKKKKINSWDIKDKKYLKISINNKRRACA